MPPTITGGALKSEPPPREPAPRKRNVMMISAVIAGLCLAGLVGWFLNDASSTRTHHDVTVSDTFTGKVTAVNIEGTAGCVQPTNHAQVCSNFATFGKPVHVGDTVHVAHEVYKRTNGNGYDMLLVVPANPPE